MKKSVILSFYVILYVNAVATGVPDTGKIISPHETNTSIIFDTDLDSEVDNV